MSIQDTAISCGDLTLIVGSNNSGKTSVLADLLRFLSGQEFMGPILQEVRLKSDPTIDELVVGYDISTDVDVHGMFGKARAFDEEFNGSGEWGYTASSSGRSSLGRACVLALPTRSRLRPIDRSRDDPGSRGPLMIDHLHQASETVELKFGDFFGMVYPGLEARIDTSDAHLLVMRVGKGFPDNYDNFRIARESVGTYRLLADQGDGVFAAARICIALALSNRTPILIDEPEAFLHPPQAYSMGRMLAGHAGGDTQIICTTHSADFLRGVLSIRKDLTIARLDRVEDTTNARALDPDLVSRIAADPMLSSNRCLEALFYSAAVLVEADADSLVYSRIGDKCWPSHDVHFVRAHNKQTIAKLIAPLKTMGVRSAAIVDFDILRDWSDLRRLLESVSVPSHQIDRAQLLHRAIIADIGKMPEAPKVAALVETVQATAERWKTSTKTLADLRRELRDLERGSDDWKGAKERGRDQLNSARAQFDELDRTCREHGVFIAPFGELESCLKDFGVPYQPGDKARWLEKALSLFDGKRPDLGAQPWLLVKDVLEFCLKAPVPKSAARPASVPPVERPSMALTTVQAEHPLRTGPSLAARGLIARVKSWLKKMFGF